ncbi:hypothetical protein XELAEV_18043345mg [Xenopus laevis]|uniref:RING-type E3 ubiquitin transferase n=1 Tax=Xenopus laevis TaxID=8355 RepID=A0A974BWU6_XENLA|nr:hypothetical protein XELAEV_18043345mg [Xenopus laevis]
MSNVAEERDRRKSIASRHHMRDVQHKIDSEYQADLRRQERHREQAEQARLKQTMCAHTHHPVSSIYSTRSYKKPWQSGMTSKVTDGRSVQGGQDRKLPDRKALSKLPAINKEKKNARNIQPKTVMQKERLQRPQLLPRLSTTERRGEAHIKVGKPSTDQRQTCALSRFDPPGDAGKLKTKKGNLKTNRRRFSLNPKSYGSTDRALSTIGHREHTSLQANAPSIHGLGARPQVESSRGTTITSTRFTVVSSDRLQGLAEQNPDGNEETIMQDNVNRENLPSVPEVPPVHLERNVRSRRAQMSNRSDENNEEMRRERSLDVCKYIRNSHLQDSEVDTTIASEDESQISDHSLNSMVSNSLYSMRSSRGGTPLSSRLRRNVISGRTSPEGTQDIIRNTSGVNDLPQSDSLSTSLDLLEEEEWPNVNIIEVQDLEGIREPFPPEPERLSLVIPADANIMDHGPHHSTSRSSAEGREQSLPRNDPFLILPFLGLTPTPTAPSIQALRENLDLIASTLPTIRHRRRIVGRATEETKVAKRPKADPERLRKIKESLLQEDSEEDGDSCRICLTRGDTTENQLISPCQCTGSLQLVHQECLKRWLISKIQSGAELDAVKTCEMCRQNVDPGIEGFDIHEQYRQHHRSERSSMNPSLYLLLLLHLYEQRYEELLRLTHTQNQVSEISRRLSDLRTGRMDDSSDSTENS